MNFSILKTLDESKIKYKKRYVKYQLITENEVISSFLVLEELAEKFETDIPAEIFSIEDIKKIYPIDII